MQTEVRLSRETWLTAAAYAELGGAVHGAGGGHLWIKASLPDPSGFLAGSMDWFAHAVRIGSARAIQEGWSILLSRRKDR